MCTCDVLLGGARRRLGWEKKELMVVVGEYRAVHTIYPHDYIDHISGYETCGR